MQLIGENSVVVAGNILLVCILAMVLTSCYGKLLVECRKIVSRGWHMDLAISGRVYDCVTRIFVRQKAKPSHLSGRFLALKFCYCTTF